MGYKIDDMVMYGKEVIRLTLCFRCRYIGEYEWRRSGYPDEFGNKILHSKKCFCRKSKRWGSPDRAYFFKKFESNSNSYKDPFLKEIEEGSQNECDY